MTIKGLSWEINQTTGFTQWVSYKFRIKNVSSLTRSKLSLL